MSRRSRRSRRSRCSRCAALLPLFVLLTSLLLPAGPAAAHPLDVYLQSAYLTPAPGTIALELDVSPGVLVAPAALGDLDADGDRQITAAEGRGYAERILRRLHLRADDVALRLTLTKVDVPSYLIVQAGYGTVRLHAQAMGAPVAAGEHEVFFRNDFAPKGATYQVNAFVNRDLPVVLGAQQRDAAQRQSRIGYRIGAAAAPVATSIRPAPAAAETGRLAGLLGSSTLSVTVVLLALGLAALLGALHALTPGHAKTIMAAYLVGAGGTTRNALTLGAVITFTHTASVLVVGLIALFAARFLVPGVLVPALEVLSGALVLAIGIRLLSRRRAAFAPASSSASSPAYLPAGTLPAETHRHDDAGTHVHSHGGRPHTHALPAGRVTPRGLIAMGVSGGLVPCPEALGVLVVAVGVNRTVFGLGLIMSFSIGIAAVLMGLGILLVRARHLAGRFERIGGRWTTALPLASALVVSVLGAGLLLKGVQAGLPLL